MKAKKRFIKGFSGLRAIAVIGVILYHLNPNTFVGGYLGVPIFFALSGYLVTDHIMETILTTGGFSIKDYYKKRFLRLYPQLLSMLFVTSAYIFLFQRQLLANLWKIIVSNILNVYNFYQILNGQSYFERFAGNESPFTHLWTMSINGQFYLLWPLLILLLCRLVNKKSTVFWAFFALTVLSIVDMSILFHSGADINRLYYGTDTRLFSLSMGACLAIVWPAEHLSTKMSLRDGLLLDAIGAVSLIAVLWFFFTPKMNPQTAFPYVGGMALFSLAVVVLIGIIAHPGAHFDQIFTNRLFDWLGSRSYAIYLYQFPVMIFFENSVNDFANHVLLYRTLEVIIILILSEVSYQLVESRDAIISWKQIKEAWPALWSQKLPIYQYVIYLVAIVITLTGLSGMVNSVSIKPVNYNKTKMAKQIKRNEAKQKEFRKQQEEKVKSKKRLAKRKIKPFGYGITKEEQLKISNMRVLAIGDSVMAAASDQLQRVIPHGLIDAAVSRQMTVGSTLVATYQRKGIKANNIIVNLGTNGIFTADDLKHFILVAGKDTQIFWVNVFVPSRDWQNPVNNLLAATDKKYKNFHVIDWYDFAKSHQNLLYGDHIHPNPTGAKYYAALVAKTLAKYGVE
ncbi:MAG: acyltransferase family protein [Lactobacillus sp.]|nr:acyltransferase family protein [Lactobacillus sp.]